MAGRRFDVADVAAVLQHWQAGRSRRQLARSFGMGRNRIDRIIAVALAAGLTPGGPPLSAEEWRQKVPELFAERVIRPVGRRRQGDRPVSCGLGRRPGGEHGDDCLAATAG